MSKIAFANYDGSLQIYKGYPDIVRNSQYSYVITYKYWCRQNDAMSLIPAYTAACTLPGLSNHKALETHISPNDTPGMVDVTVVYRLPGPAGTSSTHEDGEYSKSSNTSWIEVAIDDPRLVTGGFLTTAQVAKAKARGKVTFGIGSCEYTYTVWTDTPTWNEAELTGGLGKTSAPTGMTGSPVAANWMKIGISQRQDGDLGEFSETWKYHALGWDED